jgi:uncharacterized membrane protein
VDGDEERSTQSARDAAGCDLTVLVGQHHMGNERDMLGRRPDREPSDRTETTTSSPRTAEPRASSSPTPAAALEENVQAIKSWETATLRARSTAEQLGDWIACTAASGPVLALHVVWFAAWVSANVGLLPGVKPFDAFPFPFLTMTVSLEAIFLALFVLASQNRLARQADKRSHLDLQIDLLAEREMTAVLRLLQDIARHLNVSTSVTPEQLRDLAKKTDLESLTHKMEEFSDDQPTPGPLPSELRGSPG